MTTPLSLSAVEQAALIRDRKISSLELVEAHLRQIEAVNSSINAAVEVFAEQARQNAGTADRTLASGAALGPFHGVPFSIKDSIEIRGVVCTAGTIGRASAAASVADATLVARLRAAGGIPIARTNLPDLLFAFESDNLLFGTTNNPYDLSRASGGSSGGEAALIAACGSPMGLGSDAAGSVRLPAAFCGIAGLKPTSGRLPRTGHFPPAGGWLESIWQMGPMARRVADLTAMMRVLVGPDGEDATSPAMPFGNPDEVDVTKLRVAFYTDNGFVRTDDTVAQVVRAAAASLDGKEARPLCLEQAYDLEMRFIGSDGGDGLRQYLATLGSTHVHPLLEGWLDKLEAYRTDLAGFQAFWSQLDRYRSEMHSFLRNYDVIVCPAYTQAALPHGTSTAEENFRGFSHTMAYNVAGWPGAVVRCGQTSDGLPLAVQVVAGPWRDEVALAVAQRLEETFGGWKEPSAWAGK